MIRKLFTKLADLLQNDNPQNNETMFKFILLLSFGGMSIGAISNIVEGISFQSSFSTIVGIVLIIIIYLLGRKTKKYEFLFFVLIMAINVVILPAMFITSDGYNGGMTCWMLMCLVVLFYMLTGRYLLIATVATVLTDIACFAIAYHRPEVIQHFDDENIRFWDVCLAFFIIGLLLCLFMRIQYYLTAKERERNKRQQEELEKALKEKSLFLANMSHEIRTPINTIIGLNEMTLREDISDEIRENSENIQRASRMLLSAINSILDFSKIESGKMDVVEVEYNLSEMLRDVINLNILRAQGKGLKFQVYISPELPSKLSGDDGKIKQILMNLLSNAIKYTSEGEVSFYVEGDEISDDFINLKISVKDTGIGVKQENLATLFDDFKRINEKETRGIEGTGLGLAITKQLVELLDGEIFVDSIYHKGSTFSVTIPQKIMDAKPLGEFGVEKGMETAASHYQKRIEAPNAKVLVVDDNSMNLLVARKLFRDAQVQVDEASSGEEALKKCLQKEYDIIFMDHLMPGMDGEETLAKLRAQKAGKNANTVVIALTANAMSGAQEIYKAMGFDGYLSKPVSGEALEDALLKHLDKEMFTLITDGEEGIIKSNIEMMGKRKRKVCIATDNSCDLPKKLRMKYNIPVINHYIVTDNGAFRDAKEIFSDNLLEYQSIGKVAKSVSPSIEEFEKYFANILEDSEDIIYLATTKYAHPVYEIAKKAADSFGHVHVVDTGHLCTGLGVMALECAKMANEGSSVEEIMDKIEILKKRISTSFVLESTEQMYKTSLISRRMYNLMKLMGSHLVIELRKGKLRPAAFFAGNMDEVYLKYTRWILKRYKDVDDNIVVVTYSSCSAEDRSQIWEEVHKTKHFENELEAQTSASITAYSGGGCMGIVFLHD